MAAEQVSKETTVHQRARIRIKALGPLRDFVGLLRKQRIGLLVLAIVCYVIQYGCHVAAFD